MFAIAALSLLALQEGAPTWGGFRGNNGTGVAVEASVPSALDPETNAAWRVELPSGYSSPVVAAGRVFVTAAEGTKLLTFALDLESGEELWVQEVEFDGRRVGQNSSAAPTPVTDGERVVVFFHAVGLIAYTVDGDELWRRPLGPFNIPHGMASSPLLHDGVVVQLVDQDLEAYLAAFDAETGEERWRVPRPGPHGYSTPAVYAPAEGPAQVVVNGAFQVRSYSLVDGEELWWFDGASWQTKAVPVVAGDRCFVNAAMISTAELDLPKLRSSFAEELAERDADADGRISRQEWSHEILQQVWPIFDLNGDELLDEEDWSYLSASTRATGGLFALDLTGKGDVTKTALAWKFPDRRGLPDCPTPVLVDGLLYVLKDNGLLSATDPATGEVVKQARVADGGQFFASPVAGGGRLVLAGHGGQLAVVEAGADWKVLSVKELGEEVWSTPAIAGDRVLVRSQEALWCFQD